MEPASHRDAPPPQALALRAQPWKRALLLAYHGEHLQRARNSAGALGCLSERIKRSANRFH